MNGSAIIERCETVDVLLLVEQRSMRLRYSWTISSYVWMICASDLKDRSFWLLSGRSRSLHARWSGVGAKRVGSPSASEFWRY